MPTSIPHNQVILLFKSTSAISQFKKQCTCDDFYVDRDAVTLVGTFTPEQIHLAVEKYEAEVLGVNSNENVA
jgi:hypothetical protein